MMGKFTRFGPITVQVGLWPILHPWILGAVPREADLNTFQGLNLAQLTIPREVTVIPIIPQYPMTFP